MGFESSTGTNSVNHYGTRAVNQKFGGTNTNGMGVHKATWIFDYDDLPVNAENSMFVGIPAYSTITSCRLTVITAFADGTSYDIGLEEADGGVIDLDGLYDALVVADLATRGQVIDATTHDGANSGLLVNAGLLKNPAGAIETRWATTAGTAAEADPHAQLIVVASGTFTAGRAKIEIEYIPELPASYTGPTGT